MGWTLQGYQRICFSIDHEVETSHRKIKHLLQVCNTNRNSNCMFILQVCSWNKIFSMQWIICYQQIHYSFGSSRVCLCNKYDFQKPNEVAKNRRVGKSDGWFQNLWWSSIYPCCHRCDPHS